MTLLSRYQLVWWGWSWRFGSFGPRPSCYSWRVAIGPLEIRRWADLLPLSPPARPDEADQDEP